jgi:hypothetical protein
MEQAGEFWSMSFLKRFRILLAPAAVVILGGLGLEYYINDRLPRPAIKQNITRQVKGIFPFAFRMGHIRFSLLEGIVVEKVAISAEEDFNQGTYLVRIPELVLQIDPWTLLDEKPVLTGIVLQSAEVRVTDGKGQFIWDYLIRSRSRKTEQTTIPTSLESIELDDTVLLPHEGEHARTLVQALLKLKGAGRGEIEADFAFEQYKDGEWQSAGTVESKGSLKEEPVSGDKSKAPDSKGTNAKKKSKDPKAGSGQEPEAQILSVTIQHKLQDVLPSVLARLAMSRDLPGILNGDVDTKWVQTAFTIHTDLQWNGAGRTWAGLNIMPGSLRLDGGYTHDIGSNTIRDLKFQAAGAGWSSTLNVQAAKIRDETSPYVSTSTVVDSIEGTLDIKANLDEVLVDPEGELFPGGQLSGRWKFAFDRKPWFRPLSLAGKLAIQNLSLQSEEALLDNGSLDLEVDAAGKLNAKVRLPGKAGILESSTTGSWDNFFSMNQHTENRILTFSYNTDHVLEWKGADFRPLKEWLTPVFRWMEKRSKGGFSSPVDTFFRETDFYHRWFKQGRGSVKGRITGGRTDSQKLPDLFLEGRLSVSQINFELKSAESEQVTPRLESNLHINLISNKPSLVISAAGQNWKSLHTLGKILNGDIPSQDFSFDITANCYGTTVSELLLSLSYYGNAQWEKMLFNDTPWQNALQLHRLRARSFPEIAEGMPVHFDKMALRFRYSDHRGSLDEIRLEGPLYTISGRADYFRDQEGKMWLQGRRKDTPQTFQAVFFTAPDGSIQKSTFQ